MSKGVVSDAVTVCDAWLPYIQIAANAILLLVNGWCAHKLKRNGERLRNIQRHIERSNGNGIQ